MIYFDNASTTQCSHESAEILAHYARQSFYNPSTAYHEGIAVRNEIENSRMRMLKALGAVDGKIVFTSSGTESDNLAMFGARKTNHSRVIISAAEHAAIYYSALELRRRGYDVCLCPVDKGGRVDLQTFQELMTKDTSLVSVIHVNNETGGINDIQQLCRIAKEANPNVLFHSDGVQAFGKIPVSVTNLGVDLYSVSAHKINALKGTGALYIGKNLHINPILFGGGQETGLRSSTEHVGGIIAFAEMAAYYCEQQKTLSEIAKNIKMTIKDELRNIQELFFLSDEHSSDFILSFASSKVRGEVMQHALEREGILIGTGSACSSSRASRRVAEAIGLKGKYVDGVVRLSFGRYNTLDEAKTFIEAYIRKYKEYSKYGN